MKKKFAVVLSMVLVLSLALAACGGNNTANNNGGDEGGEENWTGSVAMVLPGLITDKAFNQFTYEGMMQAVE